MGRATSCAAALLLIASSASASAGREDATRADARGWEVLFDGTNLDAWDFDAKRNGWEITGERELYRARAGGDIYTKQRYCDFVLDLEFKVARGTNSGVFIRMHSRRDWLHTGIEIQVLDSAGKDKPDKHDTGSIYDVQAPTSNAMKPAGEWNRYTITADENVITVVLNGTKVNEIDLNAWTEAHKNPDGTTNKFNYAYRDMIREGFIAFQDHGSPVWYRNIKIKRLGSRLSEYTGSERVEDILERERARQKSAAQQRELDRTRRLQAERPRAPAVPDPAPARSASEIEAERLYKMARQAEQYGQRPAAISLYRKIASDYAETSCAARAIERLKALSP